MRIFLWQRVRCCSPNYHTEGGVVVFADTEEKARVAANKIEGCNILPSEMPNEVRDVYGGGEAVFIFPDAGCC